VHKLWSIPHAIFFGYPAGTALPFIFPDLQLRPGAVLLYYPDHTKSGKADGPMRVTLRSDLLDSTTWLHQLLVASLSAGYPITNHVARPLAPTKTFFCEHGMTASDLAARAKERFQDAHIVGNPRLHGSRRGSIQHARFIEGQPRHMVQNTAQIRCEQVMKLYEDPAGHLAPALLRRTTTKRPRYF
jgi:hypothetical protein